MRIVVGLSGGVDSSVAAYKLVEEGHEVIGLFMRNWHDESVTISDDCPWIDDSNDAMLVAEHLGIPFQVIDFSAEYHERIVDYMFSEYEQGRTPNPDILCNREIKFDLFLDAALKLGAEAVATGHYCQRDETILSDGSTEYELIAGADPNKDQSYFLCQLTQHQLKHAIFPIGNMLKLDLRGVAKNAGIHTADKKDSQGLCFIGKVRLPDFLQQKLSIKSGDIIEVSNEHSTFKSSEKAVTDPYTLTPEMGSAVGQHQGAHFFTVGQRKGLKVGGKAEPLYIIGTDVNTNTVYVGQGENHRGLMRNALLIAKEDVHWVLPSHKMKNGETRKYHLRFRYRQPLQSGNVKMTKEGLTLYFDTPQKGITAGQFATLYEGNKLVASGPIKA
jgi:tRNA-uridine 2-sulfurtransferase